jgi:hypothetical protein
LSKAEKVDTRCGRASLFLATTSEFGPIRKLSLFENAPGLAIIVFGDLNGQAQLAVAAVTQRPAIFASRESK